MGTLPRCLQAQDAISLVLCRMARALAKPEDTPLVRIGQGDTQRDIQG